MCECGAAEGDLHMWGCDGERCPFCGGQLISCSCCYIYLGYSYEAWRDNCGLPLGIYTYGLSAADARKWRAILDHKGRVPHIEFPNICVKCGCINPALIMYPTWQWDYYVPVEKRKEVICNSCFEAIRKAVDTYNPPQLVSCTFCDGTSLSFRDCWVCAGTHEMNKGYRGSHGSKRVRRG